MRGSGSGAHCQRAGKTHVGIAYLDGSLRKLHVVAPNVERTEGLLFVGVKLVE